MAEYNYQKNLKLWRLGSFGFKTPDKISYYYLKDYIGNIRVTVNEQGEIVTKDDYYPFGLRMLERSVNPDLSGPGLSYNNGNENDRLKFQSKRLQDYGNWETYYFGWRDYDPELGRWFVVDPARQFASPYVAMGNNPIIGYDEDGQVAWFIPVIIGAIADGYSGYKIAEAKSVNGLGMVGYILSGATIGGLSGYLGYSIAAAGGALSQTGSIMASSMYNSIGMTVLSGGITSPMMSFGAFSYNFKSGEFSYLGKKGNSFLENIGYTFGAMANVQDIVSMSDGTNVDLVTEKINDQDKWSHSALVNKKENINISVGPRPIVNNKSLQELFKERKGIEWPNYFNSKKGIKLNIPNVNKSILQNYTMAIRNGLKKWNILTQSCVSHTAKVLWMSGIPNIYIPFVGAVHPYLLYYQMAFRQVGIETSGILIQQY